MRYKTEPWELHEAFCYGMCTVFYVEPHEFFLLTIATAKNQCEVQLVLLVLLLA